MYWTRRQSDNMRYSHADTFLTGFLIVKKHLPKSLE